MLHELFVQRHESVWHIHPHDDDGLILLASGMNDNEPLCMKEGCLFGLKNLVNCLLLC